MSGDMALVEACRDDVYIGLAKQLGFRISGHVTRRAQVRTHDVQDASSSGFCTASPPSPSH